LGKYAAAHIVQGLINAGADVNAKSKDGQSAIIISVSLGDVATVELLLKAGANANEPDALGATARKYATLFHQNEILALFEKFAPHE
jgi:ankyrin repeat protein